MDNNLEHDYIMGYIRHVDNNRITLMSFDNHYKRCYTIKPHLAMYIKIFTGDNIVIIKRSIPDRIILDWCIL